MGAGGLYIRLETRVGVADSAIRLPTSVQTILYPALSAAKPWVRGLMDRLES